MKSYVLFLYLCCQPDSTMERIDGINSMEEAAIIFWQKQKSGEHCYEAKLLEYDWSGVPDNVRTKYVEIPKLKFER